MITLHTLDDFLHPSAGRSTEHRELQPGETCRDLIPESWAEESTCIVVNGGRVDHDYRLMEGDDVTVYLAPEWEQVVSLAVTFIVSYLLAPDLPTARRPEGPGRKTYGFNGLTNRWGHSTTVPVLFGSMRVGGHVIGFYTENFGRSVGQQMFMMIAVSEGPCHEVAGRTTDAGVPISLPAGAMFLDENDASRYAGLEMTVGMGTTTGVQHAGFPGTFIQRSVGQELGIRDNWLRAAYAAGATSCRVYDNSIFFAGDTLLLGYDNLTGTGDAAIIDSIDPDGETIHFQTPLTTQAHAQNARVVAYSPVTVTGDGTSGEGVRFNLHFPQGLYRMNAAGQAVAWEVKLKIQVRASAGPGAWTSLGQVDITGDRIGSFWETVTRTLAGTGLEGVAVDFEIQKMTTGPVSRNASYADQVNLDSIVFNDAGVYLHPGTAIAGVHGVPTAQLNGRFPNVTVQVEGVKFDKLTDGAGTFSPTTIGSGKVEHRNPAWIVLEILRNNIWGLGEFVSDDDIDFQSFYDWGLFCEEDTLSGYARTTLVDDQASGTDFIRIPLGAGGAFSAGDEVVVGYGLSNAETREIQSVTPGTTGNGSGVTPYDEDYDSITFTANLGQAHAYGEIAGVTEPRCLCDFIFDEDTTVAEAISIVAGAGRAVIVKSGNKFRAVVDRPKEASQLIDESNIIQGTFHRTILGKVDMPTRIDAVFFNRDKSFNRDSAPAVDVEAIQGGEALKSERVELKGVTRVGQAYRDARYLLRKKRLERERVSFEIALDGLTAEAGDRIDVAHYALNNGHGSKIIDARIFSGVTQVKLDDDIPYGDHSGPWIIRIAISTDDSIVTSTINGGATRGQWITLGSDIGTAIVGEHCAYGPLAKTTTALIIQEIGRTEQLDRRVIAVLYDPAIHDDSAPEVLVDDDGWSAEETGDGAPIGEDPWDDWKDNPGGDSVFGDGHSGLSADFLTGVHPDGTPWQRVSLSWNDPVMPHPFGQDVFPVTFRTAGTWNASTRTLDGDGTDSDLATEGGGRQWAGVFIRGYEVWVRHPLGSGLSDAWQFVRMVEGNGALIDFPFGRGETYEFTVVPVLMSGWKLPIADCPVVSVETPDGMANNALRKQAPQQPQATYQNIPHLAPTLKVDYPADERDSVEGVADKFEARLGGWLAGQVIGSNRGGEMLLPMLCPGAAESVHIRAKTKAGVWSDSAREVVTDFDGPNTLSQGTTILENDDQSWGGDETSFTLDGDGFLASNADGETCAYEGDWFDAGAPGASERRVLWISPDMQVSDGTTCGDATMTYEEVGQTYEGNLYEEDPFIVKTYYATSDVGGSDKKTWVECSGPVEATARYYAIKVEIVRASTNHTVLLKELRGEVWETSSTGGAPT